ncbi:MAG TPA: asparagine synthase-related protein, partial [Amaricoccus sp.]|nr:asparagine synthase-related protein [Amaricoccus sp.]
ILRRAMRQLLPPEIAGRPKSGLRVPFHEWLRGPMRAFVEERLLDPGAASLGLIDPQRVRQLLAEHLSRRRNHEKALWAILSLELYLSQRRTVGRAA